MYKLPNEVREALMNYLASKPFAEVVRLIMAIEKLEEIKEE